MCQDTFSARHGTAYFGLETEARIFTIAMRALAEGNSWRGPGRIVGVDKDTVCSWLDKTGRHCRAVTTYLFNNLHQTINTSFVERNNLTCCQCNGRLSRKVLSFSKDLTWMEKHLWLSLTYYHFVLPHSSLAQPLPTRGTGSLKKSQSVTPAMMAGITDHVWTMEEMLSYRVPPAFRDDLEQQQIVHNLQAFHPRT